MAEALSGSFTYCQRVFSAELYLKLGGYAFDESFSRSIKIGINIRGRGCTLYRPDSTQSRRL